MYPIRSSVPKPSPQYVAGMVTTIHAGKRRRLFLREHRKAKGISAQTMAGRLGIERESVLRLEREAQTRAIPEKQAEYAAALGIEPEALWRLPEDQSLDMLVQQAPPEVKDLAQDMANNIRRLVSGRR